MSVTTMGSRGWGSLWSQKTQEATAWPLRRLHRCLMSAMASELVVEEEGQARQGTLPLHSAPFPRGS